MFNLRKLPPWIGLSVGAVLFATPATALAQTVTSPASYYDWGPYYQPKVLGFSAYAQEPIRPPTLPEGISVPNYSYLLPNSPFYFTKTVFETVQTITTFDPTARQERYLDLAQERLGETYALAAKGETDLALQQAERYHQQANQIANSVKTLQSEGRDVTNLTNTIESTAIQNELIAQNYLLSGTPTTANIFRQAVDGSQILVDTAADLQGEPAIPADLSTSLQALKKQGLLTPELSDKIYSFDSRQEVRNELEKLIEEGIFPEAEIITIDDSIKSAYPQEYQKNYEQAKFAELRNFESFPKPDGDTLEKLADFQINYKEGNPIPNELQPNLIYIRLSELAKDINFDLLPTEAEKELRSFYAESVNSNQTTNLPPTPLENKTTTPQVPTPNNQTNNNISNQTVEVATGSAAITGSNSEFATPSASIYIGSYQGTLPGSPFYFVKTFSEGLATITTFDPEERLKLQMRYAEERLREANALLSGGQEETGLEYLQKYSASINQLSSQISQLNQTLQETKNLATRLEEEVSRHNILFEKAIIPVGQTGQDELQKAIVATQDALDKAADIQERATVPIDLVNRLDNLKNSGLLLPEEVAKITNAESRSEARQILRELEDKGALPPADAKKFDSRQQDFYPEEFSKLVEVRKIEELARLRTIQNDIAQTQQLRSIAQNYNIQINQLEQTINPDNLQNVAVYNNSELSERITQYATASAQTVPEVAPLLPQSTFVLPGSPFYFLKGWGETLAEVTAFDYQSRQRARLSQVQERLAESQALLAQGNEEAANQAVERYQVELKSVVDDLKNSNVSDDNKNAISQLVNKEAARDNLVLTQLSVSTSSHSDGSIKAALDLTETALDTAASVQGEPAIPTEIADKINNLPDEMLPNDKKEEILALTDRSDGRSKVEQLVEQGLLLPEDYKNNYQYRIVDFDPVWFVRSEDLIKAELIEKLTDDKKQLEEEANKNEDVVKKLAEFQQNFKPGDPVAEDIRPYVPLTRIDELTATIRPDLVSLSDFANRPDVVLAIATFKEEFKPTADDFRRLEEFKKRQPTGFLPPDLARIEALSYALGVRQTATPCYLPSPPFPPGTACPSPGAPLSVAPIVSYDFASRPGNQVYGVGPKPISSGICPAGYHFMGDSGGWCMSNDGVYNSNGQFTTTPDVSIFSRPGSEGPIYQIGDALLDANTYRQFQSNQTLNLQPNSPYVGPAGNSTYGLGPKPVSAGVCPEGFHFMSDSGGWCMSNGVSYTNYPSNQTTTNPYNYYPSIACAVAPCPQSSTTPYYYGPSPTNYSTYSPGTTYGTGPSPISPGVCPSGFHWMFDSGGWCMADGGTFTPASSTTPYGCSAGYYWNGTSCASPTGPGGYSQGSCGSNYYWSGSSCVQYYGQANSTNSSGGCNSGFYWNGSGCVSNSTYNTSCGSGYYWNGNNCVINPTAGGTPPCGGSNYYWNGSSCVSTSSSSTSVAPTSPGSCPSGYHWMSDSGGWCMSDGGGVGSYPTPSYSYPTPSSGTGGSCPTGYHWMSDSGGWCMSDGGGSSSYSYPSPSYPTPSSYSYPTPYGTPSYETPSYGTPSYEYPSPYSTPSYSYPTP